jgi:ADP-heptose:LPS heptosyltransferase
MHKTSRLERWAPIWSAAGADAQFVDLQYGDTAAERAAAEAMGLNLAHLPDVDLFNDIDGLAALLAACDLVISVSNTTAHLSGALGVPTWVMVPGGHGQMWYWGAGDMGSLWYPSATVFRQHKLDDWDDVIGRIARQLAEAP